MGTGIGFGLPIALAIWILQIIIRGLTGPLQEVPGPWYARFTNLPLKYATIRGRQVYFVDALHKRYGDTVRIAPDMIDTRDPAMFRELHRFGNGVRKAAWYKQFVGYTDDNERNHSLFTMMDPKFHADRRKLMARAFSKTEIRRNWGKAIKGKAWCAVSQMENDASMDPGREVDVMKWWILMAADVSSLISFGESFNSLETGQKSNYIKAVERVAKVGGIFAEIPVARLLKHIPLPSFQQLLNTQETTTEFARKAVTNSRQRGTAGAGNIFTGILAEAEKSESTISDLVLEREARSLIVAGTDTTALSLTFLVWSVLSRPELHRDLLSELREAERNCAPDESGCAGFSDEQLEQLPLLTAVINETLRLYGAAPGRLPRSPPPGGVTIGDMYIPDSVVVSTQAWSLHRHPALWENPEEFDAHRWLSGAEMSEGAKMSFTPFGTGARVCLGRYIAETELRYASALFFLRYPEARLAPCTTPESMLPEQFFVITPKSRQCRVVLS